MSRRTLLALALLVAGAAVVAALVIAAGADAVGSELYRVRGAVPILLTPYLLVYALDAAGWYFAFGAAKPSVSPLRLFTLRMAGESLNNVTPLGYMGGEPAKALLLRRFGAPIASGIASVVVAKTLMTAAQIAFVLTGCGAAVAARASASRLAGGALLLTALIVAGLGAFVVLQRRGLMALLLRVADRVGLGSRIGAGPRARLGEVDELLASYYAHHRVDLALSFCCFTAGWLAGVPEVLLMLRALGQHPTLLECYAIESLATVVKAAGFFVPGSLGAQEAGLVALLGLFGHPAAVSVPFSLLRRAREILWIAFGLACLAAHGRNRSSAP